MIDRKGGGGTLICPYLLSVNFTIHNSNDSKDLMLYIFSVTIL